MRKPGIAEIYENPAWLRDKITCDDGGAAGETMILGLKQVLEKFPVY